MTHIHSIEFILYVADQERSKMFYSALFSIEPVLDVPGMTEFLIADTIKLAIMPENGIATILVPQTPHPCEGTGIPRCELYLHVENIDHYYERAKIMNAVIVSPPQKRDWGDIVCYIADPDGHIVAFAKEY